MSCQSDYSISQKEPERGRQNVSLLSHQKPSFLPFLPYKPKNNTPTTSLLTTDKQTKKRGENCLAVCKSLAHPWNNHPGQGNRVLCLAGPGLQTQLRTKRAGCWDCNSATRSTRGEWRRSFPKAMRIQQTKILESTLDLQSLLLFNSLLGFWTM